MDWTFFYGCLYVCMIKEEGKKGYVIISEIIVKTKETMGFFLIVIVIVILYDMMILLN